MRSLWIVALAFRLHAAATVPPLEAVGTVTLVHPNDLDTTAATGGSLLLLHRRQSSATAALACSVLHEKPATAADLTADVRQHLSFLAFDGQLQSNDSLWVAGSASSKVSPGHGHRDSVCPAYSLKTGAVENVSCDSVLKALCTQSAPPTTPANRGTVTQGSEIVVSAGNAQYLGYRDARSFRFLGIRYGQAPVGQNRFLPTQSVRAKGLVNATQFGTVCMQNPGSDYAAKDEVQSEDCLFLNVYTPSLPSSLQPVKLKGVGFWIHGGSFNVGSGSQAIYDGGNFASRGDVVIVTINYRLDILGMLADNAGAGNALISDMVLALKWVHDNIAAFGGDPNKVTIMGESAGGMAVNALLSVPAAHGLFQAAISESAGTAPWFPRRVYTDILNPAIAAAFHSILEPPITDPVAYLRSLPADRFTSSTSPDAASSKLSDVRRALYHSTSVDGLAAMPIVGAGIQDQLNYLLGNKTLPNKVPLLVGTVRDEYALAVYALPGFTAGPVPPEVITYDTLLGVALGSDCAAAVIADGVYALNASEPDAMRRGLSAAPTARGFKCNIRSLLGIGLSNGALDASQVFVYQFNAGRPPIENAAPGCYPETPGPYHPVCHAGEVVPVFGSFNVIGVSLNTTEELHFTQYSNDVWSAFIRTHSPDIPQAYLKARGPLYAATLESVRKAPFKAVNSAEGLHIMDYEPRNEGAFVPRECAVFDNFGYAYNFIDNTY
ncbi:alpha/beta-hydrolase [Exidia glandulosa HHB12029]|uniref:Alpha/beta-hydrolase n=1 Tax=Exidia glandulosa HHB12029 TaxID=1314781 RepID=A0A165PUH2_EXIGL|nr:alpha/beta-hydrolase [Exidia glandulosa HHB12029]